MRFITIILLMLLHVHAKGQTLKGTVRDGVTGLPLAAVAVRNLNTAQAAYTGTNGTFVLNANKGDQVSFSLPGYKIEQKSIPLTGDISDMKVDLFSFSIQLEEFTFRSRLTPYQLDSAERHAVYSRTLARERSGSVMSPVTLLAERLSKRSKQIFRFQQSFNYWEGQKFLESRYAPQLVGQLTRLTGDTLAYFMNAYPLPYDFARVASDLELKMWIRENYKAWLKHPNYPSPPADSNRAKQ